MHTTALATPTFNLKAVVKETRLKPDTLRAWERRYGLPQPQRSKGGHRLYCQHDIDTLKWLVARQEEGLSISRAVDLWHNLLEEGRDPLVTMPVASQLSGTSTKPLVSGDALASLREAWLDACLNFDEPAAENTLTHAFALFPAETVCLDIIRWGLAKVGSEWYAGKVTVQQEHFTTAMAMRRMQTLIAAAAPPTRQERILIACPPAEAHSFSPLLLTWLLRRQGWTTLYLGANVPLERFEPAIQKIQPHIAILTGQQLYTAATLREMGQVLNSIEVPFAYGGLVFNLYPDLRLRIPGHYLGDTLEEAPGLIENLLQTSQPLPSTDATPAQYPDTRAHYLTQQPFIHARVQALMNIENTPMPANGIAEINEHLSQNIIAALSLGDIDLLGIQLLWVSGLLSNRSVPLALLDTYIKAYDQAAGEYLDERGKPVLEWLDKTTGNGSQYREN
ncbi:MAG: MerR family transcriptional regulator [Chloroflexi bacterium]|nr:MerR family transcriptional regulator [Chloroflexota bacterium]